MKVYLLNLTILNWRGKIKKYLTPPIFDGDPEKTKTASLSYRIFLVLLAASIVYAALTPINPSALGTRFLIIGVVLTVVLISLVLTRKGHIHTAHLIFLINLWIISVFSVIISGGVSSQTQSIFVVLVVLAGFLQRKKAILVWSAISLLTSISIYILEKQGFFIPSVEQSAVYLISHLFFLLVIAFIFYLSLRQYEIASAQLKIELFQKERAETEHRRSEIRFRQSFELSPMPVLISRSDGQHEFINQRLTELLGYTIDDLPDIETWYQKAYPDPNDRIPAKQNWDQQIQDFLSVGKIARAEHEIMDRWGHPHIIDFYARTIDEKTIVMMNDVTDQRRMEAVIRENEILYRALFDNIQDGILLMDGDRFIECNHQILSLFGCQKSQIIGKTPLNFSPEEQTNGIDSKTALQFFLDKTKDNQPQTFEWLHTRLNGTLFTAQITLSKTLLPKGQFFLAQVRDISKQKQDQVTIQRGSRRMDTLYNLETVISTSFDLETILTVFLDLIIDQSDADAAAFLLYDPSLQLLKYAAGLGFHSNLQRTTTRFPIGYSLAGKVAQTRQTIQVDSFLEIQQSDPLNKLVEAEEFVSYCGIPMVVKGELKGVLEIFQRQSPIDRQDWFTYIETLANRAAIAIDNAHLFANLQRANLQMQNTYDTTLEGWVYLLSQRDDETEEHTRRVVVLTELLAKKVGIKDHDLVHILRGALLHDIGKIVVPDQILFKPGPLNEAEWKIMRQHPVAAYQSLIRIDYLKQAVDIPHYHHERWDGSGYPRGLKGKEIPLPARIFAIIDVWDALSHDRPYRKAWDKEKILTHMQSQSGLHFDPEILKAFFELIQNEIEFLPEA